MGHEEAMRSIGLSSKIELGEQQVVHRSRLLQVIDEIDKPAKGIPKGFHIRVCMPSNPEGKYGARAMSGFLIDGIQYVVFCNEDSWKMYPMPASPIPSGKVIPLEMRGEPRRIHADIPTENYGIVKVEIKKGRSDVSTFLSRLRRIARTMSADVLIIVVG
jgi:hypothetical protein